MNYPLISEYIEAIKSAEDNFKELTNLRPVHGDDGQPVMTSGNFAVVFKMQDVETGKFYALKCFTKEQEGRAEAYHQIADALKDVDSPYLVSLRYLDKELFVDTEQTADTEFPVLLMDWVEGKTLDKYLRENIDDKYALEMLAYRFSLLAQWLIPQPFAHGDLKPDNILVREDSSLVLVDYDGMYVPPMKGQKARELGSPNFRHPLRTEKDFDEHIDDFPLVSILLSLKAISFNPILFEEYGAKDRLLFSSNDYYNIKGCGFLSKQIPSGNKILDRYAYLFSAVFYDEQLPSLLHNLIPANRPLPLIPYRISSCSFSLYDKINQKILPLRYQYVDFVDPSLETSTSCIISNITSTTPYIIRYQYGSRRMLGYWNAAIVSRPRDILDLHWYTELLYIGNLRTHFIAKDSFGKYGVIDDQNNILLDFIYQKIEPVEVREDVYLVCKKGNYYGVLNKELKVLFPFNLLDVITDLSLKLITYKNERGSSLAMDLTTFNECKLPDDFNKISDYKEGILTFEIARDQYRFYSFEKQEYINSYTYQGISEYYLIAIKNSYVLCKRGQSYILLAIDGTEYPINIKGELSQYGETVIGVTLIKEKYIEKDGLEYTQTNYEVSVFKKNILLSKFVYEKNHYDENFNLISEDTIRVWHWEGDEIYVTGMYETHINLKGEHVSWPKTEVIEISNKTKEENTRLIKLVKKYLNSTYISDIDSSPEDERDFFNIRTLKNLAIVSYHWDPCDDEGCETIEVGYADEDMCYWSKDCIKKYMELRYLGYKVLWLALCNKKSTRWLYQGQ